MMAFRSAFVFTCMHFEKTKYGNPVIGKTDWDFNPYAVAWSV